MGKVGGFEWEAEKERGMDVSFCYCIVSLITVRCEFCSHSLLMSS